MKSTLFLLLFVAAATSSFGQITDDPCSDQAILQRNLAFNPNALAESADTELALQRIIKAFRESPRQRTASTFVIPVVMHVFHLGDDGKMDMEQALSGLEILNTDINGLNDDWDSIDEAFDPIKEALDITFCLATIDPDGNPTTGLIYHESEAGLYNQEDLFQYAWDNYKYLNIYFPKYTQGGPSDFTAYAYYPSTTNTNSNRDGIFYSSIRWGFGNHSELVEGDEWASVCTHEVGHWLDLRHTFQGGCSVPGDYVDDTPPTTSSGLEPAGCNNNDFSCNVHTNGENYMDYNIRCKKMFTQGQVERMLAALYLPSRINLWSEENLMDTGCFDIFSAQEEIYFDNEILVYPNPASHFITFKTKSNSAQLSIFNTQGQLLKSYFLNKDIYQIDLDDYVDGIYFFTLASKENIKTGKFVISK